MKQRVEAMNKIPGFDPRTGEHYWITIALYHHRDIEKVIATADPVDLDKENHVSVGATGCYYCEEPFRPQLLRRRCRGHGA